MAPQSSVRIARDAAILEDLLLRAGADPYQEIDIGVGSTLDLVVERSDAGPIAVGLDQVPADTPEAVC